MKYTIPIGALLLLALFGLWGCENDTTNDLGAPAQLTDMTCLGCHSSEAMLKETLGAVATAKVGTPFKDDG